MYMCLHIYYTVLWQAQALKEIQRIFVSREEEMKKKMRRKIHGSDWLIKWLYVFMIQTHHTLCVCLLLPSAPFLCFFGFHSAFFHRHLQSNISQKKENKSENTVLQRNPNQQGDITIIQLGNTPSPFLSWLSVV